MHLGHLTKRELGFLVITVFIFVFILSYNLLIGPLIKRWKSLNIEIISKQIKLQKNLSILEKKSQSLKTYNQYYPYLKSKGSNEEEMAEFLSQIETLAKNSNLSLKDIKPGPIKDMKLYKEFSCSVEVEAPLSEISRFMLELTKPPYLLKTKRCELRSKGGRDSRLKGSLLITKLSLI